MENSGKPTEYFISNLSDLFYLQENAPFFIEKNKSGLNSSPVLWFRGHHDSRYSLIPSLYRRDFDQLIRKGNYGEWWNKLQEKEKTEREQFTLRTFHLIEEEKRCNELLTYGTMQHYKAPTRLLDWTDVLWIGLYFALEKYLKQSEPSRDTFTVPCLWVFKPLIYYSELKRQNSSITNMPLSIPNLFTDYDVIKKIHEFDKMCWPAYSPSNNDRVKTQSGSFTVFPICPENRDQPPLSFGLEKQKSCKEYLLKIMITAPHRIAYQLNQSGMKRSLIYPELTSFAEDITFFTFSNMTM